MGLTGTSEKEALRSAWKQISGHYHYSVTIEHAVTVDVRYNADLDFSGTERKCVNKLREPLNK